MAEDMAEITRRLEEGKLPRNPNRKGEGFTREAMHAQVAYDLRLSRFEDKLLDALIWTYCPGVPLTMWHVDQVAKALKMDRTTLWRALKRLQSFGYISYRRDRSPGGGVLTIRPLEMIQPKGRRAARVAGQYELFPPVALVSENAPESVKTYHRKRRVDPKLRAV